MRLLFLMLMRNVLFFIVALSFSFLFTIQYAFGQEASSKFNIVFFLVDDLGWQDTAVPFWDQVTVQNKKFHTPNMLRLAKKSVKFTNAYATPICTPSRVSLMTGMNAARHRVTNWTRMKGEHTDYKDAVLNAPNWNFNGLSIVKTDSNTVFATPLPQLLKQNGYFTIHCGKAHFSAQGISCDNPLNLGFDKNIAGSAAGNPASYLGDQNFGFKEGSYSINADLPNLKSYWGTSTFLTEALTLEAKKAIDTAQQLKKPFFLYMANYAVHLPYDQDSRFFQKYIEQGYSKPEAAYCALVEGMDKSLGDLMDYLDDHHLSERTIIIFMSDNGGFSHPPRQGGVNVQNAPLRGGKGSVYEGGIREPMMVYWPGVSQAGSISSQYMMIEDFFPTVLQMANIRSYKTVQKVDGRSIVPFIKDSNKRDDTKELLWHYPNKWYDFGDGINDNLFVSAFRKGDWKLVYLQREQKLALYHLKTDIGEAHDLATQYPKKLKEMAKLMTRKMKAEAAQRPTFVTNGKLIPYPEEL